MSDRNPNRIGALWYPQTQNDKAPAAKGTIEINGQKITVVVWRNKWKKPGEKTPDLFIDLDQPRDNQGSRPPVQQPAGDLGYGRQPASRQPEPQEPEFFDDDIPF
jgi:hypothetical protein